jgi:hypothetical protein
MRMTVLRTCLGHTGAQQHAPAACCCLLLPPQRLLKYLAGYNEDQQLVRPTAPLALKLTRTGRAAISSNITVALFLPFDIQVG